MTELKRIYRIILERLVGYIIWYEIQPTPGNTLRNHNS